MEEKNMKYKLFVLIILSTLLSFSLAGCSTTSYVSKGNSSYCQQVSRKLGRGVINTVTSPLEIPNKSIKLAGEGESAAEEASGYVAGIFLGTGHFVWRLGAGLVDIITAPVTFWEKALVEPEFIHFAFKTSSDLGSQKLILKSE